MTTYFKEALKLTSGFEGGTNDSPVDRGGLTKWGISSKQYPEVTNPDFSYEDAEKIYYEDYWLHCNCDTFSLPLAKVIFDSAVNCGQPSAGKWLQMTCNHVNGCGLIPDGVIGDKTTVCVAKFSDYVLIIGICAFRLDRYADMIKNYPSQMENIEGWIRRLHKLQLAVI